MGDTPVTKADKDEEKPGLALHFDSDAALAAVPWWSPDIPPWEPIKERNSSLRIACVVSDRLYQGLQFEGEVYLLTPDNWRTTLAHGVPDLLLVESFWESATGHWNLAQAAPGAEAAELRELVATARRQGIPAAYWFTEDGVYHDHYREMARHFEHVFCADAGELERLKESGIVAHHLPPCVQPALYNPFRWPGYYGALDLGVLFDGWGDLDRYPDDFPVLDEMLQEHRLSIIESRCLLTHNRLRAAAPARAGSILGCVTRSARQLALKYASVYVTFERSLSTATTREWQALEATASYIPIVHSGHFLEGDLRADLAQAFEDDVEFQVELLRMKEDSLYRQRIAHRAWRETLLHHTYSHRVRSICERLCIQHDWNEYPKASVITPTCRPDMASDAIRTYRRQSYPERELILVYNGELPSELPEETKATDIRVAHVPGDRFAGATLNLGERHASGCYCFRVDDDDIYGRHYLLDMMLWLRCNDAHVLGKLLRPMKFDDSPTIHLRPEMRKPFQILRGTDLAGGRVWLSGNSIAFRRKASEIRGYRNDALSAADTFFNRDVPEEAIALAVDFFNDIGVRRSDGRHTWQVDRNAVEGSAETLPGEEDLVI